MRVIAGSARSMPLRTVKGLDVRPTTDRTKETLFNIIQSYIPGCRFLDLFAGSGSIGIEALSRGAEAAFFVEKDPRAQKLILENLEFTKLDDRAVLKKGDVFSQLPLLEREDPFDVIFMDPPFRLHLEKDVLTYLKDSGIPSDDAVIIVECEPSTDFSYLPELGFDIIKQKIYGNSSHVFLKKSRRKEDE
ncbi:MAG: 16S rRNA (guanine(966)-N(2))-methyltransferase RsmD [Lachnospiraceae bacterium]|jgi:16S rRNA (guanine966-N2)-methyltransferase|nr:16S rRNA (guanine(966)-N(2))-methyltransferase RsmD [Lachnospiraceae bacterium]